MNETAVAEEILKLYSQLPLNGKPSQKQYTVLSGIVGVISSTSHPDHRYLPICLCTGTKCLSNHDSAYQQGVTLSDSHAEILARRSLIRYLILSAIEVLKSPEYASQDNCPLRLHQTTDSQQEFVLKPEWSFWLYISDSPCGDASVYQRTSLERCFTGKKSQQCDDGAFSSSDPHALSSLLRCKPGRVDLKGTQRASSMSCSDKICRWSCLGLQGFVSPFSCHLTDTLEHSSRSSLPLQYFFQELSLAETWLLWKRRDKR
jgi:tRNA-specific adenosine deaminase 1